jgi:hypothetical protein
MTVKLQTEMLRGEMMAALFSPPHGGPSIHLGGGEKF